MSGRRWCWWAESERRGNDTRVLLLKRSCSWRVQRRASSSRAAGRDRERRESNRGPGRAEGRGQGGQLRGPILQQQLQPTGQCHRQRHTGQVQKRRDQQEGFRHTVSTWARGRYSKQQVTCRYCAFASMVTRARARTQNTLDLPDATSAPKASAYSVTSASQSDDTVTMNSVV
jgi:hypothetical protein